MAASDHAMLRILRIDRTPGLYVTTGVRLTVDRTVTEQAALAERHCRLSSTLARVLA
jgi:hypothetical protein